MTCVWEADPGCLGEAWSKYDVEVQERALMLATSSLQTLTYYRVGTCPITIRPCVDGGWCGCEWSPYLLNGTWFNGCKHRTKCTPLLEIDIPGPVGYIDEFKIDGAVIDLTTGDWRVDNGHLLVWQGSGASPVLPAQDLNKPDTEVGTWSITYSQSYPVEKDAELAVAYLAVEFAKACTPSKTCSLPRGVTSVVRSGVSFTLDSSLFPGGLTGIDIVDAFILKWAPAGSPTQNATVFDPRKVSPRVTSAVPLRSSVGSA